MNRTARVSTALTIATIALLANVGVAHAQWVPGQDQLTTSDNEGAQFSQVLNSPVEREQTEPDQQKTGGSTREPQYPSELPRLWDAEGV
jgi:hypothetical protein